MADIDPFKIAKFANPNSPEGWREAADKFDQQAQIARGDGDNFHAQQAADKAAACRERARELQVWS